MGGGGGIVFRSLARIGCLPILEVSSQDSMNNSRRGFFVGFRRRRRRDREENPSLTTVAAATSFDNDA